MEGENEIVTRIACRTVRMLGLLPPFMMLLACATQPNTTRLQVVDFEDIAIEMASKLRAGSFLKDRSSEAIPMIIAVNKVENLSSDILSDGEKWYLIDRVIDSRAISALRENDNIRLVIPAEKLRLLNRTLGPEEQVGAMRSPTHTMTARLLSLSRSVGRDRTELYDCQFILTDLAGGEIVWTENVAIKRVARGRMYN